MPLIVKLFLVFSGGFIGLLILSHISLLWSQRAKENEKTMATIESKKIRRGNNDFCYYVTFCKNGEKHFAHSDFYPRIDYPKYQMGDTVPISYYMDKHGYTTCHLTDHSSHSFPGIFSGILMIVFSIYLIVFPWIVFFKY